MFINFSNHPSIKWSEKQRKAAVEFKATTNGIIDIPFPEVSPIASTEEIEHLADKYFERIIWCTTGTSDMVLVQGELTLAYAVISLLHKKCPKIKVVAACSDRIVQEVQLPDGTTKKEVQFKFVQFREYPRINCID